MTDRPSSVGLFDPWKLRGVSFRNRVMVAPMWQYSGVDGRPADWHMVHLGRFAIGGASLVMQEGTSVLREHRGTVGDIGIWHDDHVEEYSRITRFIASQGAVPAIQLMHAGRKARTRVPWEGRGPLGDDIVAMHPDWQVVGATDAPHSTGYTKPEALDVDGIAHIVRAWGDAARRADAAGYEVLEVHAGHGYLLHEFLSATTNTRVDRYGGSFENRSRLLFEVVEKIRSVWPERKPLFLRISAIDGDGWTIDDSVALAERVRSEGVDVIDCSSGGMAVSAGSPLEPGAGIKLEPGYQVPLAAAVRTRTGMPTIAVGLISQARHADDILRDGHADMIAIGRELLWDPNWPARARHELGGHVFDALPVAHAYYLNGRAKTLSTAADSARHHAQTSKKTAQP